MAAEGKKDIFVRALDARAYAAINPIARQSARSFEGELRFALRQHAASGLRIYRGRDLDGECAAEPRRVTVRGLDSGVVETLREIGFINGRPLYEEVRQALYRHAGLAPSVEDGVHAGDADDMTAAALAGAIRR